MRRTEQYSDQIARLYPPEKTKTDDGQRILTQSITFQVTDDCNLACCFVRGTKILMSNNIEKNIEDIQLGDKVMGYDDKGVYTECKVEQLFELQDMTYTLFFDDYTNITGTGNHEMLLTNGYKSIADIELGDQLIGYTRTKTVINKTKKIVATVYNIGVTPTHTYIANGLLTKNCYCYQGHKGKNRMSFETAKKFFDLVVSGDKGFKNYINPEKSPGLVVDFIGGEPFLEVELIDQICTYIMDKLIELNHPWAMKTMFSICSNGTLYRDEKVQAFLRKWANRLSFSVTIDGNKELHDSCRVFPDGSPSYDIAVDAASDWMKRGNHMGSKITIAPGNISFLYDAVIHMIDLGYDEINANCVYEEGWTAIHATTLYDQMKRLSDYFLEKDLDFEHDFFCSLYNEDFFQPKDPDDLQCWCGGTGNSMIACDPQGRIFPCIRYMESSLNGAQEPYSIGDVDNGIGHTKCYECRIQCMAKIDRRTSSTDECFYCPIATGCSNCSGYDYQVNGTPDSRATFICIMHKARALGNLYFWNKYYRKHNMEKRMKNYVPDEWALEIISESELNMLKELERED